MKKDSTRSNSSELSELSHKVLPVLLMDGVINQHPLSLGSFEPTPESCWSGQDQLRRQARGTLERSGELYIHETMVVTTHSAGKYIILINIIYNIVKCGHGMSLHFLGGFWPSWKTLCIGPSLADFASL